MRQVLEVKSPLNRQKKPIPDLIWRTVCFLLASTLMLRVNIVGSVTVTEFFLPIIGLFLFSTATRIKLDARAKILLGLLLLHLFAQIISDSVHGAPGVESAKLLAKTIITGINFLSLYYLIRGDRNRELAFIAGTVFGSVTVGAGGQYWGWKWVIGPAVLTAMTLLSDLKYFCNRNYIPLLFIAFGLVSFAMNARTLAGFALLLAAVAGVSRVVPIMSPLRDLKGPTVVGVIAMATIAFSILQFYSWGASSRVFGEEAFQKWEIQQRSGQGILLGGRLDFLVSWEAIKEKPWFGHGAGASGMRYQWLQIKLAGNDPTDPKFTGVFDKGIPVHSFILGSVVQAGLLTAPFWLYAWYLCLKALVLNILVCRPISLFKSYIYIQFGWDMLFSPFGADRRVFIPFILVMAIFDLIEFERKRKLARRLLNERDRLAYR